MSVNGHKCVHDECDETQVLFRSLAWCHEQNAVVCSERPVVVLTRTVDALEWFLVEQDSESVSSGNLSHE